MQRDDLVYVGHILETARRAVSLVDGISRTAFDQDEVLRLAVTHLLQTIGESARRVSQPFRDSHPQVPWPAIIGMRHRIVHDYLNVDDEIVWQTATVELLPLIDILLLMLQESQDGDTPDTMGRI